MRPFTSWALAAILTAGNLPAQNSIAFTAPGSLVISSATAGGQPATRTDQTARYSVTVTSGRVKVTGLLQQPLPSGVTLTISLAAPGGAMSMGTVTLSGSSQDLVRFIPVGQYNSLTVTLSLTALVSAGVVPFETVHVTLTLVDDP